MHSRTINALSSLRIIFSQLENEAKTYTVNWAGFLDTDTVSTSAWSSEDSALSVENETNTTTSASARLSGDPGRYRAVNKITTAAGDTHERFVDVLIRDNTLGYIDDYGFRGA